MKLENMGKALDEIREGGRFRKVQDLRMVTASKASAATVRSALSLIRMITLA